MRARSAWLVYRSMLDTDPGCCTLCCTLSGERIQTGWEMLQIQGYLAGSIQAELLDHAAADVGNEEFGVRLQGFRKTDAELAIVRVRENSYGVQAQFVHRYVQAAIGEWCRSPSAELIRTFNLDSHGGL